MFYIAILPESEERMYEKSRNQEKGEAWFDYLGNLCGYKDEDICIKFASDYEDLFAVDFFFFCDYHKWHEKWYKKLYLLNLIEKSVYVMSEPKTVLDVNPKKVMKYYHYIFNYNTRLVDNKRIFRIPAILYDFNFNKIRKCEDQGERREKLLVAVFANKTFTIRDNLYLERYRVIDYCNKHYSNDFDLYGHNWEKKNFKCYKGVCTSKIAIYQKYKFAICMENSIEHDYVTEKIIDCLVAGIVPIYLGAPNIQEYVPRECYILYENFANIDEMMYYIRNMSEEDYDEYVKAGEAWLDSDAKNIFSDIEFLQDIKNFVKNREHSCFKVSKFSIFRGSIYRFYKKCKSYLKRKLYILPNKLRSQSD